MNLPRFLKVLIFASAFFICSANGVYAQLSITPVTWNVIGLDSNKPATDGPNVFPVGVKVCNTSSSALSNLNTTFYWDSTNSLINLDTGGVTQSIIQSSLAANACVDVYFTVVITRSTAAYNTSRRYHITSSATGAAAVSTPTPREIFVEKLVSQNRNTVNSIVGPTTVYVGQTYNYTVNGSTATNGYEQLEAFLNLSNVIFRVLSVNTTYSVPAGATNDKIYADSCGWDNNPTSPTYRSCTTAGKAGGTITTVYSVLVLSAGTTTASTLIYDFSGSSYHYNSDFGIGINSITITALPNGSISGKVFNDVDGLTGGIANLSGTNAGTTLYANLLDSTNKVVQSVLIPPAGTYSFTGLNAGSYTVQLSTNQGTAGTTIALPSGWVNTGENLGTGTGTDGTADGLLAVAVGTANTTVTNANFGIEQIPTANNQTAAIRNNPGGTTNVTVSPTLFTGSDTLPGIVASIRITAFPNNATTITINGVQYTAANFPAAGVTIPAGTNGNPTQNISIDPIDGAVTVPIRFVTIDNAGMASSPNASAAAVSIPFQLAPTASGGEISGTLFFGGNPLRNALVVLVDTVSNSKSITRTDASGNYRFDDKTAGKTYIVQPLSSKYAFTPGTSVVNLVDNALGLNFDSTAKKYHPKNDFDGDGSSDIAVYRPSDGNWYVLKSSDGQMSSFQFGADTDIPVSGDFDGDGKADYAVFRPETGVWYVWQSKTQDLRAEQFGLAADKLVPADYDGDGKTDIAVYRNGNWYIRRSSDGAFEAKNYGANTDTPITGDFDGDGKADLTVYRPADGIWYTMQSASETSSAKPFGLAADIPLSGDFDGDGLADIAQFRNGFWYVLNSATDFEAIQFGAGDDKLIAGDYDGDGRADTTVFRSGLWSVRNSGSGVVKNVYFGFPTDIPVR